MARGGERVDPDVREPVTAGPVAERPPARRLAPGTALLLVVLALFLAVALPVLVRGAPLADDFTNCVDTQRLGFARAFGDSIDRLGVSRKAHLLEILVTGGVCGRLPFGYAIAVPLALTVAVAFLLRGLLRDVGAPAPWPDVAAALWLLAPLGTESALWPAALHVPLGLALALLAIRLYRSGRPVVASLAAIGAGLSAEQVLLALPVAVWLLTPAERRRRSTLATLAVVVALLAAFIAWPGSDPRLHVTLAERLSGAVHDPAFPFLFAAVGLGLQSIPLAVVWAFPSSVALLVAGAGLGWWIAPRLAPLRPAPGGPAAPGVLACALGGLAVLVAADVPIVFSVPHQGSPRLFAPSWLVLAAVAGLAGPSIPPARLRVWGAAAAAFAVGALLSLALSAWVRIESADFSEYALRRIAAEVPDGSVVGVCGVTRTVVDPAPRGAFALHELVYDWSARDALEHYTGERVSFVLAGRLWDRPCPSRRTVDRVFSFPRLVSGWRRGG
jgi:hypothetical protein